MVADITLQEKPINQPLPSSTVLSYCVPLVCKLSYHTPQPSARYMVLQACVVRDNNIYPPQAPELI